MRRRNKSLTFRCRPKLPHRKSTRRPLLNAPLNAKLRRRRKTPRAPRPKRHVPSTTRSRNAVQRPKPKHVLSAR